MIHMETYKYRVQAEKVNIITDYHIHTLQALYWSGALKIKKLSMKDTFQSSHKIPDSLLKFVTLHDCSREVSLHGPYFG